MLPIPVSTTYGSFEDFNYSIFKESESADILLFENIK